MERSVFSDRMVFVRAVHEAKWMNEMEISIYDCWASPDTCHKRMMLRKRAVQGGVSLKYLQDLQEKHESLLLPFESGSHGVLSVSKPSLQMDNSLHPDIKDHVFYLEGNHMHSSIQKVPALFLDCEPNIDFSRDIEAKRQYARQVAEFFEREACPVIRTPVSGFKEGHVALNQAICVRLSPTVLFARKEHCQGYHECQ
ncbi:hypothetical protein F2Q70_00040783 [Brassica cretica]|uniref:Deoxynucleoside kinase domain-containing protein n=1 Tax=Brassica cretica TaxID=69181 RepID=A0A8S9K765_BRACR|nr:hypothetical protein F2Q70_00040783 [Brassica cretica]